MFVFGLDFELLNFKQYGCSIDQPTNLHTNPFIYLFSVMFIRTLFIDTVFTVKFYAFQTAMELTPEQIAGEYDLFIFVSHGFVNKHIKECNWIVSPFRQFITFQDNCFLLFIRLLSKYTLDRHSIAVIGQW